ncbi:hypothetical protein [Variovorax sp. J31P179]|uniref:hypothetical protein n=1 Tax=Variovorax sp. J31P179 TaxID=3053508 RepID=UPI0025780081|nr:hypothetical protein [Variovorax sp. J31P179]
MAARNAVDQRAAAASYDRRKLPSVRFLFATLPAAKVLKVKAQILAIRDKTLVTWGVGRCHGFGAEFAELVEHFRVVEDQDLAEILVADSRAGTGRTPADRRA